MDSQAYSQTVFGIQAIHFGRKRILISFRTARFRVIVSVRIMLDYLIYQTVQACSSNQRIRHLHESRRPMNSVTNATDSLHFLLGQNILDSKLAYKLAV